MFQVGHIYTHSRMNDVCMLVVSSEPGVGGSFLEVRWFKKNGLDLNAKDKIYIKKEDYIKWMEL